MLVSNLVPFMFMFRFLLRNYVINRKQLTPSICVTHIVIYSTLTSLKFSLIQTFCRPFCYFIYLTVVNVSDSENCHNTCVGVHSSCALSRLRFRRCKNSNTQRIKTKLTKKIRKLPLQGSFSSYFILILSYWSS